MQSSKNIKIKKIIKISDILTPEINIIEIQVDEIKTVWPKSGWLTSKITIVKSNKKLIR